MQPDVTPFFTIATTSSGSPSIAIKFWKEHCASGYEPSFGRFARNWGYRSSRAFCPKSSCRADRLQSAPRARPLPQSKRDRATGFAPCLFAARDPLDFRTDKALHDARQIVVERMIPTWDEIKNRCLVLSGNCQRRTRIAADKCCASVAWLPGGALAFGASWHDAPQ